jgi:hypothetical protein
MPPRPMEFRYWTCAATMYREEQRAAHHIEKPGFDYYLPLTYVPTIGGDGERRTLPFPGFIFIRLGDGWESLSSARGIKSPASHADPAPARSNLAVSDSVTVPSHVRTGEIQRLKALACPYSSIVPSSDHAAWCGGRGAK